MQTVQIQLSPRESVNDASIRAAAAAALGLPVNELRFFRIKKRSVDARQRNIKVLLTLDVLTSPLNEASPLSETLKPLLLQDVHHASRQVIIIGAGPAGLFAALTLIEHGIKPIVLERGKDVSARKRDIAALNKNEGLNDDSNYCFGEGGAGTFSDGKLFSRSKKRGDMQRVLQIFHIFGADDNVLYETHAHIGSDKLPAIIRRMRETIIEKGGEIHFGEQVVGITYQSESVPNLSELSVSTAAGHSYQGEAAIVAIGHSAHDTYRMLADAGLALEPKGFALGVRVEHSQSLINRLMYHLQLPSLPTATHGIAYHISNTTASHRQTADKNNNCQSTLVNYLGNASYSLLTHVTGRSVYSFCMCPGGHIVPAGSTKHSCVVNGMSASHRNSPFANSGIGVEVRPEDVLSAHDSPHARRVSDENPSQNPILYTQATSDALRFLSWAEHVEQLAWIHGAKAAGQPDSAIAPAQRLTDFVAGRQSTSLPSVSYLPGCVPSRLDCWLPQMIAARLRQAFLDFDRKYPGFLTNDAVILGVESRSSSPVRICRDKETNKAFDQHGNLTNIYPAGEGAGYAGGITSSALDGINTALQII